MPPQRSAPARFYLTFFGKTFTNGLVWPATAGNVFWSALTLAVDRHNPIFVADWGPRMALLVILSGYLAFVWQSEQEALSRHPEFDNRVRYWLFDQIHVLPIAALAIMAATRMDAPLSQTLMALFAVTIAGHLFGAWETDWRYRIAKALANLAGIVLLLFGPFVAWRRVLALGTVIAIWVAIEIIEYRQRTRRA